VEEDETQDDGYKLDKYLGKMFEKSRLLELIHDFVLFDGGMKKLPRVHQYFGIKAAQAQLAAMRAALSGIHKAAANLLLWCCWPNGF
jgi:type I restriction enzyme R subunit